LQDFRGLDVWQKARRLATTTYRVTASFPASERFGLTDQMRRCAISIAANISEGCGRGSDTDFARFVQMAIGSACELECHCIIAVDLGLLKKEASVKMCEDLNEVRMMLIGLNRRLRG